MRTRPQSRELAAPYTRPGEESPTSVFPSALIAAHRGDLARARRLRRGDGPARRAARHEALRRTRDARDSWSSGAARPTRPLSGSRRRSEITDAADGAEPTMSAGGEPSKRRGAARARPRRRRRSVASTRGRRRRGDSTARWPLAEAARCRGLVAAARGDVDEAIALAGRRRSRSRGGFGRRRARCSRSASRAGGRGRSGRRARRSRRHAPRFEELGAAGWAARARDELGRDRRPNAGVEGLTARRAARRRPGGRRAGRTPRSPRRSSSRSARSRAT